MLAAWWYTHPGARRFWLLFQAFWGGSLCAVLTAPRAAAEEIGAAFSWTGLRDSYGVPIGAHVVSVVPMAEALRKQGTAFGITPDKLEAWVQSKLVTGITYTQLAEWLGVESAILAAMVAFVVWFVKFALSTLWLSWLAQLARPILTNINAVTGHMMLVPGAFLICAAIGGVTAVTRGIGRGVGIIFGGGLVIAAATFLLRDPVGETTGDNGLLGIGRSLGFAFSQGLGNNGPLASGGTASQLDRLGSDLVDVLVRQQVEIVNFGRVIDDGGTCTQAYTNALLSTSGDQAEAAHAVGNCAPDALDHAQHLSATTAGLFICLIVAVFIVLAAIGYISAEVIRVGCKAFWHVLVIVPASPFAIPPGPPRQFVKRTALKLLVHFVEMVAATAGLGILVIFIADLNRGSVANAIGMVHPVGRLVVMLLLAAFGAIGFRAMLKGFGDRGMPGPLRLARAARSGVRGADSSVKDVKRTRKLGERVVSRGGGADKDGGSGGGDNSSGSKAPGRKAHPQPAASGRRPPSAPSNDAQTRPGPSGPGRGSDSGEGESGTRSSGAQSSPVSASRTAGPTTSKVVKVAGRAAAAAAPEAAAVAKVVGHTTGEQRRDNAGRRGREDAPGRSAKGGSGEKPATPSTAKPTTTSGSEPARPQDDGRSARRDAPPPGRSGPVPSEREPRDDAGPATE